MKKKLVFVGFAFGHHLKTHAGYHQIRNFLKYDIIIDGQSEYNFVFNTIDRLPSLFIRYYRRFFGWRLWFTELRCIIRALLFRDQVFHIIYGENILKYLGRFKGSSNEIVCTYHQPASIFEQNVSWARSIKEVDKVILVSSNDRSYFSQFNEAISVKYIPHGVDTDFYLPGCEKREYFVLMVGNWLRDFSFSNNVFNQLLKEDKEVKINVITNRENFKYFLTNDRLKLETNITDEHLRNLYQKAGLVFLPLIEFTACNSILEAAACGAEILIATNSKKTSYFYSRHISYTNLDQSIVKDHILNKLKGIKSTNNVRESIVNNYSWDNIAKITRSYLEE